MTPPLIEEEICKIFSAPDAATELLKNILKEQFPVKCEQYGCVHNISPFLVALQENYVSNLCRAYYGTFPICPHITAVLIGILIYFEIKKNETHVLGGSDEFKQCLEEVATKRSNKCPLPS